MHTYIVNKVIIKSKRKSKGCSIIITNEVDIYYQKYPKMKYNL